MTRLGGFFCSLLIFPVSGFLQKQTSIASTSTQLWSEYYGPAAMGKAMQLQTKPEPEPPTIFRVQEKLCDRSIEGTTLKSGVFVDSPDNISEELIEKVSKKAMRINIKCRNKKNNEPAGLNGQAGIYREKSSSETEQNSCKLYPVTARHNIRDDEETTYGQSSATFWNEKGKERELYLRFSRADIEKAIDETAERIQIRPSSLDWDYYDFVKGDLEEPQYDAKLSAELEDVAYDWVPEDFELREGMEIGMVVRRSQSINWNVTGVLKYKALPIANDISKFLGGIGIQDPELLKIYGKKNQVCIYTGQIKKVNSEKGFFEHSINSFQGCSGATIFLLDNDDNYSEHHGKALGVHAGGLVEKKSEENVEQKQKSGESWSFFSFDDEEEEVEVYNVGFREPKK